MKSTFSIVYSTSIHILLAQSIACSGYLVYREHYHTHYASVAQYAPLAQNELHYDVQSYNDLMNQAQREISAHKGGR